MDLMERSALNRARAALDVALTGAETSHTLPALAGSQFVQLALALARADGKMTQALSLLPERGCERARDVLKAAIGGGALTSGQWGATLASFREIADGFATSPRAVSVPDLLIERNELRRLPVGVRLGTVATGATAGAVGEGASIPVTKMGISGDTIPPTKVGGLTVVTADVFKHATSAASSLLAKEMRGAIGTACNTALFAAITAGAPTHVSSGTSSANQLADFKAMAADLSLGAASRLYFATSAILATKLSLTLAFSGLSMGGGMLPTILPVDGLAAGTGVLFDSDGVAGDVDAIQLAVGRAGSIEMDTAPTGSALDVPVPRNTVSLFQDDAVALRLIRFVGFKPIRACASTLTAIAW